MDKTAVTICNLSGGYKNKTVLHDISLKISKGSFTAIAGPNGSGKTTILKYLIKELKAPDNTIKVFSNDINSYTQKELSKKVAFVNQTHTQYPDFTVLELAELGRFCYGERDAEAKALKALEKVGIKKLENCLLSEISGGELQLAMLSRALCQDSDIILLDEPINSLDPKHQMIMLSLLKKLSQEGKTIVCVLHDLNAILNFCDYCILIKDGKVFKDGKACEVISENNIKDVYDVDVKLISQADGRLLLTSCYNL